MKLYDFYPHFARFSPPANFVTLGDNAKFWNLISKPERLIQKTKQGHCFRQKILYNNKFINCVFTNWKFTELKELLYGYPSDIEYYNRSVGID